MRSDLDRTGLEGRNIWDLRNLAHERLPANSWAYLSSGAADSFSAEENAESLTALHLLPRVLRDVSDIDTTISFLGQDIPHPAFIAPTGCHRLFHEDGEIGTSRGAATAGAPMIVSTYTTTPMEDIAFESPQGWLFQLNPSPDRDFNRSLITEAARLGAAGVMVSVDTPVPGPREGQNWNGVDLPEGIQFGVLNRYPGGDIRPDPGINNIYRPTLDATFDWSDLRELIASTSIPVIVKGILHPEDALLAADSGAASVVVSNHGGRNLDTVVSGLAPLRAVCAAVAGRLPVLYDGGIRRGTDIVKVLAAGATAVLIGRPSLWGLAVGGSEGVTYVIDKLVSELRSAMALCGTPTVDRINSELLST